MNPSYVGSFDDYSDDDDDNKVTMMMMMMYISGKLDLNHTRIILHEPLIRPIMFGAFDDYNDDCLSTMILHKPPIRHYVCSI